MKTLQIFLQLYVTTDYKLSITKNTIYGIIVIGNIHYFST